LSKVEDKINNQDIDYEEILNDLNIGYYRGELQGKLIKHNKVLNKIFGYDLSESLIGIKASDFLLNEEEKINYYKELLEKGSVQNLQIRIKNKKGSVLVLQVNSRIVKNDRGNPLFVEGTLVDITEKFEIEQKLKDSENKYKLISENANDMIAVLNNKFEYEYINEESSVKSMGYRKEEVIGKSVLEFIHPDDILEVTNALNEGLKKGEGKVEFRFRHKNGSWVWLESRGKIFLNELNQIKGIVISRDITERKKAEEKAIESERKYKDLSQELETILDIIPGMIFCKNKNGKFIRVNKALADSFKLKKEEIIERTSFDLFPKEQADAFQKDDLEVMNTGKPKLNIEQNADFPGKNIYLFTQKVPLTNNQGDIVGITGLAIDITDRKRIEQELKNSEEDYRNLYEEAPNAYFSIGADKIIIKCNKAAEKLLGYSKSELLKMKVFDLYAKNESGLEKAKKIFEKFLKGNSIQDEELLMQKKDGENIWISLSVKPKSDKEGNIIESRSMVINVSDRKEAEQKLKESEKKYREAYDKANFYKELIAHDMNNILQTIQSSVELYNLFQKSSENVKYRKEVFDIISSSVFRGSSLVSNIIKLSEIEETKFPTKIIEAKRILDNSIEHINRSYQGLKLNIKVETDLIKIYLKANELLSDLFENLLVNAVKHNENPEIEIQIKISEEISNETKYAKFEFLDNGIGILDEIKQELFEKSIDRKSSKKGLGIGLSLVRQIVKSYNGKIWVENRVEGDHEKGSNFIVLIPAAD